jgi:hypothetical protein
MLKFATLSSAKVAAPSSIPTREVRRVDGKGGADRGCAWLGHVDSGHTSCAVFHTEDAASSHFSVSGYHIADSAIHFTHAIRRRIRERASRSRTVTKYGVEDRHTQQLAYLVPGLPNRTARLMPNPAELPQHRGLGLHMCLRARRRRPGPLIHQHGLHAVGHAKRLPQHRSLLLARDRVSNFLERSLDRNVRAAVERWRNGAGVLSARVRRGRERQMQSR